MYERLLWYQWWILCMDYKGNTYIVSYIIPFSRSRHRGIINLKSVVASVNVNGKRLFLMKYRWKIGWNTFSKNILYKCCLFYINSFFFLVLSILATLQQTNLQFYKYYLCSPSYAVHFIPCTVSHYLFFYHSL